MHGKPKRKKRFSASTRNDKSSKLLKNAWKEYRLEKRKRLGI